MSIASKTKRCRWAKGVETIAGLALIGGFAAACGSTASSAGQVATVDGNAPWMTTAPANSGSGSGEVVNLTIQDISTPEGSEPAYIGPNGQGAADLFSAAVGKEVQVVVVNKDAMPHTFTAPDLGLNVTISPESTTKFTFVAKTAGTFSWYCSIPCGSWVMSHAGYMKGDFKVA